MSSSPENRSVWEKAAREADITLTLPGGIPLFFRRIPAGDFLMGSRGYNANEEPIHRVRITQDFYLGTFAVTQEQNCSVAVSYSPIFKKITDPNQFKGVHRPTDQASWFEATAFCQWLADWKELPHNIAAVRLPTEAEWEYACRAGTDTEYNTGDREAALEEVGWFNSNSGNRTHSVGEKQPNGYGLYDMHGNVCEWCHDVYDENTYRKRMDGWIARARTLNDAGKDAKTMNPGPVNEQVTFRVQRGGSWYDTAIGCRSATRNGLWPGIRNGIIGFRVCLILSSAAGIGVQQEIAPAAEPAPGDGARGPSPESDGAGAAESTMPDLSQESLPPRSESKK